MSMNECMAELFGKATGCSKGKGGSMHFFAPDKNYWGGHGIVAGQTPLGLGLAYALKYKGLTGAALCFLGDGAVNQGVFHESPEPGLALRSAGDLHHRKQQYSMGTSLERSSAFRTCLAERAEGFAMDWDTCNGEDLYEVRAKTEDRHRSRAQAIAPDGARDRHLPLLRPLRRRREAKVYRSAEEIERYKQEPRSDPASGKRG